MVPPHPVRWLLAERLAWSDEFPIVPDKAPKAGNKLQPTTQCRSSLLLGMAPVLLYVVGVATAVCAYQSAFQVRTHLR